MNLLRIAARVASTRTAVSGGMGISVLNRPQTVDIPGLGPVEVVVTKVDSLSENHWKNVEGTVNGVPVSTSGGKNRKPTDSIGPGLEGSLGSGPMDFRPIDALSMAISQVLAEEMGEAPEFPTVENGMFLAEEDPGPGSSRENRG